MRILTILIIALSSNMDNLGVGLAYGTRRIRLPFSSNLLIAVITSCGTLISMVFGKDVAILAKNQRIAGDLGAGIIVAVGLYFVFQSLRRRKTQDISSSEPAATRAAQEAPKGLLRWLQRLIRLPGEPFLADKNYSRSLELGEAAVLGVGLTLNNLPNGFAAGLIALSPALTTAAVFIISLLTLWFGIWVGERFTARLLRAWAGPIAGIVLTLLGVYEFFN
jgi:putative sporulation protein YtaF